MLCAPGVGELEGWGGEALILLRGELQTGEEASVAVTDLGGLKVKKSGGSVETGCQRSVCRTSFLGTVKLHSRRTPVICPSSLEI